MFIYCLKEYLTKMLYILEEIFKEFVKIHVMWTRRSDEDWLFNCYSVIAKTLLQGKSVNGLLKIVVVFWSRYHLDIYIVFPQTNLFVWGFFFNNVAYKKIKS